MNSGAVPIAVKIVPAMKKRIEHLAEVKHRTTHWMMREAFRLDGIKAWNEYQASGLHLTQEEADAWLANLEVGQDLEPPECHA